MANQVEYFQKNSSNFIYIFIDEQAAKEVFGSAPKILDKRQKQIRYVEDAAKKSAYTYNDFKNIIARQIQNDYGMTPGQLLLRVCNGKNVYSLRNISAVAGIGAAPVEVTAVTDSAGNKFSLADVNNEQALLKSNFVTVSDMEQRHATGIYNVETGEQAAYFNNKNGKWYAGAAPASDPNSRSMWGNNINWTSWIIKILDWIGRLLGVVSARDMVVYQSDGWYSVSQNMSRRSNLSGIVPLACLAVVGYMLVYGTGDNE